VIQRRRHVHEVHEYRVRDYYPKTWRHVTYEQELSQNRHRYPMLAVPSEPLVEARVLVVSSHAELLSVR